MNYIYFDSILSKEPIEITQKYWIQTITHPLITRLCNIAQLGNTSHAFVNCTHSRYPHSLGTGKRIDLLLPAHVERSDREKAVFAGLCHDLGHGPFSHSLEHFILPRLGEHNWRHEEYSVLFAKEVYDQLEEPSFEFSGFAEILHEGKGDGPNDVFQLISSKTTGFDADRYDYLLRDSLMVGRNLEVNWERLTSGIEFRPETMGKKYCQVLKRSAVTELAKFLSARYVMFDEIYHHNISTGADLLVADIFYEADKFSRFAEKLFDPETFLDFDDSIMQKFKVYKPKSERLKRVYERYERKDFYKFCDSIQLGNEHFWKACKQEKKHLRERVENEILELLAPTLTCEHVVFTFLEANECKDVNLEKTYFEAEDGRPESLKLVSEDETLVSLFGKRRTAELRVYLKNEADREAVSAAVKSWRKKNTINME